MPGGESKTRQAERLLRADPDLNTRAVAQIVGCSKTTVTYARAALGMTARRATRIDRCRALLREQPDLDLAVVAEAVGCSYGTAYAAAKRLGVNRDRHHSSAIGTHRHHHVGRGTRNPECQLCRAEGAGEPG